MLWDSIMRGFPIGSIILAPALTNLDNKPSAITHQPSSTTSRWHLLDGQQRCNAIAWGFVDPWEPSASYDQILWIDLLPDSIPARSTRKYLFRVTTIAHPWGFGSDDNSGLLSEADRRTFLGKTTAKEYESPPNAPPLSEGKRPKPQNGLPIAATFPVPMAILWKHFNDEKIDWNALADDPTVKWGEKWHGHSIRDLSSENRYHIEKGISNANKSLVVALFVTSADTAQSQIDQVAEIEQIFVRLNRQGTPLSNEDLAYTLLKSYWPDVDRIISGENPPLPRHSPPARMVNMGIRVALTRRGNANTVNGLSRGLTAEQIRDTFSALAKLRADDNSSNDDKKTQESIFPAELITRYFSTKLRAALEWIDTNLIYKSTRAFGIPPYLRSSIAWSSPSLFAWLMYQAGEFGYEGIDDQQAKRLIGAALCIHWFGEDRERAVDRLFEIGDAKVLLKELVDPDGQRTLLRTPLSPNELKQAIHATDSPEMLSNALLKNWENLWQGVVRFDAEGSKRNDEQSEIEARRVGYFVDRLQRQRELLVYAQREYISSAQFQGFDPSNPLMWKGHNRPWDYDHILATARLDGRSGRAGVFHNACKSWQSTIGNLVAIDFSTNRGLQDSDAAEKSRYKKIPGTFTENRLSYFSEMNLEKTNDLAASQRFIHGCQGRILSIYSDFFESLDIGGMLL